jgi:hypothetical protein
VAIVVNGPQLCAICGVNVATTRDHVPPKAIFAKPRPALTTVPACFRCNNAASGFDESFFVYLSLHVGIQEGIAKQLFDNHTVRSLGRNQRLLREINANSEPVLMSTPAGITWGIGRKVLWNSRVHDAVIERTIRGLYFHHFREILASRATIKVQWLRGFPSDVVEYLKDCPTVSVGGDRFVYKYGRAADQPLSSMWLFLFYGHHFASGYTLPTIEPAHTH